MLRMVTVNERIARRIKQARQESGLTQEELAKLIHVSSGVIVTRYERGQRAVSAEMLQIIADVTHKRIGWFFEEEEPPQPESIMDKLDERLLEISHSLGYLGRLCLAEFAEFIYYRQKITNRSPKTEYSDLVKRYEGMTTPKAAEKPNRYR